MRQLSFLDAIYHDPAQAHTRAETERGLNEYLDDLEKHQTRLRAAQAAAPIVLPKDALTAMDGLLVAWVAAQKNYNAKSFEELRAVAIRTMTRLTEVAQRDLLIRPGVEANK